jgi:hypothetical protein
MEAFSEEVLSSRYACPAFMGEQASIPSDHQGSTDRATDECVFGRFGQVHS